MSRLTFFSLLLRRSLCSRSGLCHRCCPPELVHHPALSAHRSSARHSAGSLHVLVQPLLCFCLLVWDRCYGQDDPHSHAGQELVLWSKLNFYHWASFKCLAWHFGKQHFFHFIADLFHCLNRCVCIVCRGVLSFCTIKCIYLISQRLLSLW